MSDFLVALGLVLVLEGFLYGGLPSLVKRMAVDVIKMPESVMRVAGILVMIAGIIIIWLVRH